MTLYAALTRALGVAVVALLWLLAVCAVILLPVPSWAQWAGLVAVGFAAWVQHRPKRVKGERMRT